MEITYILNLYRRPHVLLEQIESIKNQTVAPTQIMIWKNSYEGVEIPIELKKDKDIIVADCSRNLGVWSRFSFALNAKTEYICVIDDDSIIGKKWAENCLNTMMETPGLLGTRGLRFKRGVYHDADVFGWESCNEKVEQVDIVGHAWFFKREWLTAFFRELPPPEYVTAGEDINLSWMIQKYLGLNTYVPPHPKNDPEMWGSLKAIEYGVGVEATSNHSIPYMSKFLQHARKGGFRLINE